MSLAFLHEVFRFRHLLFYESAHANAVNANRVVGAHVARRLRNDDDELELVSSRKLFSAISNVAATSASRIIFIFLFQISIEAERSSTLLQHSGFFFALAWHTNAS